MRHALGWQFFRDIFRESQTHLWPLAERHLYYQYHEYFSEVAPYLERMIHEAPDETGEPWGRLVTLALLSGHIVEDDLFQELNSLGLTSAWVGASQVFAANLDRPAGNSLCIKGLRRILQTEGLDKQVCRGIEHAFDPKNHGHVLDKDFALEFMAKVSEDSEDMGLDSFLDWIADLTARDPISSLDICERLAGILSGKSSRYQLWHTEPLISTISSILREADETDNQELINRAIRLQDQFLRMDIHGMNDYFKHAGQS